jgi:hypothetical protein
MEVDEIPMPLSLRKVSYNIRLIGSFAGFQSVNVRTIASLSLNRSTNFVMLRWFLRVKKWIKVQADQISAFGLRRRVLFQQLSQLWAEFRAN